MSISFTSYSSGPVLIGTMAGTQKYDGFSTTDALPVMFGTMLLPLSTGQPLLSGLMLGSLAYDGFATTYAEPVMFGEMPLALGYAGSAVVPSVGVMISGPPLPTLTGVGTLGVPGTMSGVMVQPIALDTTDALPDMFGVMPLPTGISIVQPPVVNPIMLMQYPGFLQIFGQHLYEDLMDHGVLSDSISTQVILNIFDAAAAATTLTSGMTAHLAFNDMGNATDVMVATVYLSLAAGAAASDNLTASLTLLLQASDLVQASDALISSLHANVLVATIATASTQIAGYRIEHLADTIVATTGLSTQAKLLASLMDQAVATTTLAPQLHLTLLLSNTAQAEDSLLSQLRATNNILEIGVAYGNLHLTGQDYTFYAMSVEKGAVSQYTNFQGNSMAPIMGHVYAAFDDGIYIMEGGDDAGANIDARVRTGLDTLGVVLRKEAPNVYIGYTSTGAAVLKVITTDDGTKKENWYALNPIPYESTTENRFRVSKGLHSVYWGYELAALDGSEMTLDFIKVWRLVLSRRKK